jgi:hypothetical protein
MLVRLLPQKGLPLRIYGRGLWEAYIEDKNIFKGHITAMDVKMDSNGKDVYTYNYKGFAEPEACTKSFQFPDQWEEIYEHLSEAHGQYNMIQEEVMAAEGIWVKYEARKKL